MVEEQESFYSMCDNCKYFSRIKNGYTGFCSIHGETIENFSLCSNYEKMVWEINNEDEQNKKKRIRKVSTKSS